ncbi:unnamed protein product [marine sediment metagenome]|uniref:Uncharacterized protein n=1 Tax=marine sediment metagenome TaxID=412755 RepID=X1QEC3_9ZZZZ
MVMSVINKSVDGYSGVSHSLSLTIGIPGVMRGVISYCGMVG